MTGDGGTPWWASGTGPVDGLADDDPVRAHREARRGVGPEDGPTSDDGDASGDPAGRVWWEDAATALGELARQAGARYGDPGDLPPHDHGADTDVCEICPVCVGLRVLERSRPELVAHLSEALRHVTLAVKSVVDAHADATGATDGGLERIDLDDE
jgi:hypothetical protein